MPDMPYLNNLLIHKSDQIHGISPALSSQFSCLTSMSRIFFSAKAEAFSSKDEEQNKTVKSKVLMTDIVASATLFLVHAAINQVLF